MSINAIDNALLDSVILLFPFLSSFSFLVMQDYLAVDMEYLCQIHNIFLEVIFTIKPSSGHFLLLFHRLCTDLTLVCYGASYCTL
jgi:hypothetical protein